MVKNIQNLTIYIYIYIYIYSNDFGFENIRSLHMVCMNTSCYERDGHVSFVL